MYLKIIKLSELEYYLGRQDVCVIDVRSCEAYKNAHMEGALSVPADKLERFLQGKDSSKLYLLYCERGITSLKVGRRLAQQGYRIGTLAGGFSMYDRNRKSR